MEERKVYTSTFTEFNGRAHFSVVIDQHYKEKHPEISDALILEMLSFEISGKQFDPEDEADDDGFQYFKIEPVIYQEQPYRLILVTHSTESYLGVVNAFRVEKKK